MQALPARSQRGDQRLSRHYSMASFNFSTRQMSAKIVYYGPGLCGKTTSLKHIFHHTRADARGKMVSLATETDRTLFFDLLPLEVGTVAGFHTRIQLYTVPGQVFYNSTRRLVLKGVDGIVFVADSQPAMLPSNVESFRNMEVNLAELGIKVDEIPLVLQYNKRDLPEVCSVAELREALNSNGWPEFETSALDGAGVFEVLREISKLTLVSLKQQLDDGTPETFTPPSLRPTPKPKPVVAQSKPAESRPAESEPEPAPPTPPAILDPEAPPPAVDAGEETSDNIAEVNSAPDADAENVDETSAEESSAASPPASRLSDDEIEDRALEQLGDDPHSQLMDAVPDRPPVDEPPAETASGDAPSVGAPLAETLPADEQLADATTRGEKRAHEEPIEPREIEAIAATNGRRQLDNALSLALSEDDFERVHQVSVDLQVRDERDRVLHQVRDIQWSLAEVDDLGNVLLHLKIELGREDA